MLGSRVLVWGHGARVAEPKGAEARREGLRSCRYTCHTTRSTSDPLSCMPASRKKHAGRLGCGTEGIWVSIWTYCIASTSKTPRDRSDFSIVRRPDRRFTKQPCCGGNAILQNSPLLQGGLFCKTALQRWASLKPQYCGHIRKCFPIW